MSRSISRRIAISTSVAVLKPSVKWQWERFDRLKKKHKAEICEGWVNHDNIYFFSWSNLFFCTIGEIMWVFDHWLGLSPSLLSVAGRNHDSAGGNIHSLILLLIRCSWAFQEEFPTVCYPAKTLFPSPCLLRAQCPWVVLIKTTQRAEKISFCWLGVCLETQWKCTSEQRCCFRDDFMEEDWPHCAWHLAWEADGEWLISNDALLCG